MMKRNIHGIFLLDKPLGGSSNHALQKVKRLFNAAKAGHTGSLDPLATGMLPICLGEATKYSQHLLDADKCYEVTAQLGVRTDTGDAEGQIIASSQDFVINAEQLANILQQFTGNIQQIPPMHSALKHKGMPLYEYARKGETIERPARTITIYALTLIEEILLPLRGEDADRRMRGDQISLPTITLRVHCSKGTYIRSLIDDIGEELGCGAHVSALRRLWVAPFQSIPMMTLEQLEHSADKDALILPLDAALTAWPKHILDNQQSKRLLQGLPVFLLGISPGFIRFYDKNQVFLGVGNVADNGEVIDKRLINFACR